MNAEQKKRVEEIRESVDEYMLLWTEYGEGIPGLIEKAQELLTLLDEQAAEMGTEQGINKALKAEVERLNTDADMPYKNTIIELEKENQRLREAWGFVKKCSIQKTDADPNTMWDAFEFMVIEAKQLRERLEAALEGK
jgi:hypothetical protein